jgi:hypothetical protein
VVAGAGAAVGDGVSRLDKLDLVLAPWYIVGPPWNEAAPWINAVDDDPHNGAFICDFIDTRDDDGPRESVSSDADAAFIAHAREDVPWLLGRVRDLEDALRRIERAHAPAEHLQSIARAVLAVGDSEAKT